MTSNSIPKHSFELLFASLIAVILLPPIFTLQGGMLVKITLTLVLISSLYLVTEKKTALFFGSFLALATILTAWSEGLFHIPNRSIILTIIYLVFFSYISVFLFAFIVNCKTASSDIIFSAMCLYIFIANIWMFIYALIFLIKPESFSLSQHIDINPESDFHTVLNTFSYYSFVTITSVGYGDIVPTNPVARAWVSVEAVIGQLYLAVILAKLVGLTANKK